jgi:hypothetical protein
MTPRRILLVGWLVFLLYAFPGYMTAASTEMLNDARFFELTDWHPPLMTFVWRIVITVWYGPAGMLFLQSGCLLFGGFVLLRRHAPPRRAAFASAGVLVFPPVMAAMAVIEPDALLTGFLVAGTALVTAERRPHKVVGLVVMMLACGLRDAAWLAVLPLVVFGFVWDPAHRRAVRYTLAAGAWLAAALLAYGTSNLLIDHATRRNDSDLAMYDVAGTLARADELTDARVRELAPGVHFAPAADLQRIARLERTKLSELRTGSTALFVTPRTDDDVEALLAARANLRAHAPGAYAATRLRLWLRILYPSSQVYAKDNISMESRILMSHGAAPSMVQRGVTWVLRLLARTPLFAPMLYLVAALILIPFARRLRPALLLLASGLLLELALAVTTWHAEFRYSTWLITATLLAGFGVVCRRGPPGHLDRDRGV